jgi:GNAT superfamily N-acetyltransferase
VIKIEHSVETEVARTTRVRQLEAMFDVPAQDKMRLAWSGAIPLDEFDWKIGMLVGPSGSGKSQLLAKLFRSPETLAFGSGAVIDDFPSDLGIQAITDACSAVGFNTIPAWMRPYAALSNGERFRVELARRLLSDPDPVVIDEFTSVVDRQVAKIAAAAAQKYARKRGRRLVVASCHYDVIDWLQPDWTLEPAGMIFTRRSLQRRPTIECTIGRVSRTAWRLFAPFHYMSAALSPAARCFGLWVDETLAAFAALLFRPASRGCELPIWGVSRTVTLPDWQGLGLSFALVDRLGAALAATGRRLRHYPAHPPFIRALDRSPNWCLVKRPGTFQSPRGKNSGVNIGQRNCAIFEFIGEAINSGREAQSFLGF